ncbi:choice-of-anchor P family protein [Actinokineospora guangxiensis]|uniref:Choice-of-anchor P family protein n=1 Tax=Actinokineospora guangxiensis TaxID=1490288 RepID=A0ABW0EVU3_9PSEU
MRSRGAALVAAVSVGVVGAVAPAAAEPGAGSAFGASAKVSLLPGVLGDKGLTVDTGRLAPSSTAGPTEASLVDVPLAGLVRAKAVTSSATAAGGGVHSTASIVDVRLPVLAGLAGRTPTVRVISSKCTSGRNGVQGSATITDINLGSLGSLPLDGTPNQRLSVPGVLELIVNEQVKAADGTLTVTALRLKLLGGNSAGLGSGDIALASSTCGKALTTAPPTTTSPGTAPTTTVQPRPKPPGGRQVVEVPVGAPQTGGAGLR